MRGRGGRRPSTAPAATRTRALALVVLLVAGLITVTATVAPAPEAAAATVTIGTIQGQMANHVGVNNGTSGNCIKYAPTGTSSSSALVSSPNEAQTAHGRPNSNSNSCPANLNSSQQSTVGFRPSGTTSAQDGQSFLIGRMIHYNNPVYSDDRYYTGQMNTVLGGFTSPNAVTFDWQLDETPNSGGGNCCNDLISFTNQISTVTLTQGGLSYRLVILGFIPTAEATVCPSTPPAGSTPQNEFSTVEGTRTHACLYASLSQVRTLTIVKTVNGTSPPAKSFSFGSTSSLAGSAWSNSSFALNPPSSVTRSLVSGESVTVTEVDPGDDRWALTALTCTQIGANGQPQPVPGATLSLAARQVVLNNVPAPPLPAQPGITCTYTNTYTPKATLTLVKQVQSGSATPNLWTLTATGSAAPPPSGATISGPSGSAAVATQRVPAGTYALTEVGTGQASSGYAQVGDWSCRTTGGGTLPVTAGSVTLPDSASTNTPANVTCTVVNQLAVGALRIAKVVNAPAGAYTGGTTKAFTGTYDCGTGFTGPFSATTAIPAVINNIPVGRTCAVTETPPTGGLANASYVWGPATYSAQPVTITQNGTATVTVTNSVVQKFGTFAITKTVSGPGGYIGGTGRVFPVAYACTLANGTPTTGTLDVTTAKAVSPATPLPTGSVCTFTETLTVQGGDFSDPSYVWSGYTVSPTSVTIGDNTTSAVTITNTYTRQLGSLVVAKVVQGGGYLGGTGANFTVDYNCGVVVGTVAIANGGSVTIPGLPAGNTCTVQERPPAASLLSPAFVWGTPTWSPAPTAAITPGGTATLTVTNPTIPVFGRVSVTKQVTGATQGVTADARFTVTVTCPGAAGSPFLLTVAAGGTATTPDIPVGTSCTVSEAAPTGGLVDPSYEWGATPADQVVTISSSGQVVGATMTNTVERVRGQLSITKASIAPAGVVDPAREFVIDFSCVYGNDAPVADSVSLLPGATAVVDDLLLGSACTVTEDAATLTAAPSATDPSWVWLPPTYSPAQDVVVESEATPVSVTVTNRIQQLTGGFSVTKEVTGTGKDGGYTPGDTFGFAVNCGTPPTFDLADTQTLTFANVPAGTECTVEEVDQPDAGPAYRWLPVQFTVVGAAATGTNPVTFTIPANGSVQVTATNTIEPVFGSVAVRKTVSGLTAGFAGGITFGVTLNCGAGQVYVLQVARDQTATQGSIPAGSSCTAVESAPTGGLVDASYAWGPATYAPANATVTVPPDGTATISIDNPIVRVTAPVRLVKSYSGPQGVIDPARTYPVTWSCTYNGTPVAGGTQQITANPDGVVVATDVPLTSVCTATEGDLGSPSADPAFRWLAPVITGTTVTGAGANTITVANTLTRDSGIVRVQKSVTGAVEGYIGTGEAFTLHGQCLVPGQPQIPTRYADGSIADGGTVDIVASVGWTCSGFEDSPGQNLLRDASYAWGPPVITGTPPLAADGTFVLPSNGAIQIFKVVNPIVRVTDSFTITKAIVDPNGVVQPSATFAGTYRCVYGEGQPDEAVVTGDWSITPSQNPDFVIPDLLLGSVCTVTENDPGTTGLPDGSWSWLPPDVGEPGDVVTGATGSVTVTNTVTRLWAGLQVTKTLTDPDGGLVTGTRFTGAWECVLGSDTYGDRFDVPAGGTQVVTSPGDERVPAAAVCSIVEDTPGPALRDASFAWDEPTYTPPNVTLVAGETATLGVTNTVIRVYSDVTIQKDVTGPADGLVPQDRAFTGTITCQYGTDAPIVTTWSATQATPALRSGVLVGSVCTATEDQAGAGGQPVDGDPSYIWLPEVVSAPVTVTPPDATTPPIVVTNPTARLFGSFDVTKTVSGAVDGIVDPTAPYRMTYSCQPGSGEPIAGTIEVPVGAVLRVGPELQIPSGSVCTLTEPLPMPPLRDGAWAWDDPSFTTGSNPAVPAPPCDPDPAAVVPCASGRALTFQIPTPQEDIPEPIVEVGVNNNVTKTDGEWSVAKSSDPASGAVVAPGSAITYSLTVDSTGTVPVHDVVVTDDLASVLPYATVVDGSVDAPDGTSAAVDTATQRLVWSVGTVDASTSLTLTYQVIVNPGAAGVTVRNQVTGTADVPPTTCAQATLAGTPLAAPCSTDHPTPLAPTVTKESTGPVVWDPASGTWTVGYRIVAVNPNSAQDVPYSLTDVLGFPVGTEIVSAAVTLLPDGVTPASPAWDGVDWVTIVENATLPAGGTHTYELSVTADVPTDTAATILACAAGAGASGNGLYNQVSLDSLGSLVSASACEPVPTVLTAQKRWVINGVEYPDGKQPEGFSATLQLDGEEASWLTDYVGYPASATVEVGENATVPAGCASTATGLGPATLNNALTAVTVVNMVTCAGPSVEPTPPTAPQPPSTPYPPAASYPPTSPYPPLPNTGFDTGPFVGWGIGLVIAGALFIIGAAYRRRGLTG